MGLTRRELLERLFALASGALFLSFFLSLKTKRGAPEQVTPPGEGPVKVSTLEKLEAQKSQKFQVRGEPGLLLLVGEGVKAYSARCPHMGCPVSLGERVIECPCHGSTFAPSTGRRLSGPAPKGLRELEVEVKGGEVYLS